MKAASAAIHAVPWYKQFWPWFLIALPTAVVIGCIVSVSIAFKYADVPVQDDYEKHGLTVLHKQNLPSPTERGAGGEGTRE